ncbi:Pyrimidine-specific ribonucleoside hydrolase RihA [Eufriesea mexicana]|uniref:Pyrimidine-specific ribonucleoside hydrolase RihA n=1 Tax=Eufriesea mexicana TaxID=516756 RepID=A0A310SS75_9HYME|nr:PREDICTED: non-specific ribonucleoside hydrolase RihC-like [Eufriesea mexicana]OAD58555.1 Pyrimidine-specific ribonucleoside hydrolase RihA [Eufriesea mexicana]
MKIHIFYSKIFVTMSFCLALYRVRSTNALEKVIIDTDAGADDAVAIFLTLKSIDNVLAITCSYGNTYVENVAINVLKILTIANRSDIPVYKGAQKPLINEYKPDSIFGSDGLGDFDFTEKIMAKVDESKHAAVALIDLVKKYPNEVTLLSIGPSTNVAIATALEPSFSKYLKNHIILGSSVCGVGNVLPNIEFNFYQDPESNYIILNKTITSVLFPWETVVDSYISMDWRKNVLGKMNSTIMSFLNKAEQKSLSNTNSWSVSDAMAAAVMLWPELAIKSIVTNVSPVIDGFTRGSVVVDYTNLTSKPKNARIILSFNTTAFQQLLLIKFS